MSWAISTCGRNGKFVFPLTLTYSFIYLYTGMRIEGLLVTELLRVYHEQHQGA